MTFRPSAVRVAGLVAFSLGASAVVAVDAPVLVRVAGWMFLVLALLIVPLAARTWIRVRDGAVEVGRLRGSRTFEVGRATVRELPVPGAIVGPKNSAVQIKGADGRSVTIALTWFSAPDQREVVRLLRETLHSETGSKQS